MNVCTFVLYVCSCGSATRCGQRPVLCKASGLEYDWVSDPLFGQRPVYCTGPAVRFLVGQRPVMPVLCKASGLLYVYAWVSDPWFGQRPVYYSGRAVQFLVGQRPVVWPAASFVQDQRSDFCTLASLLYQCTFEKKKKKKKKKRLG